MKKEYKLQSINRVVNYLRSGKGVIINADVNAALNIIRKAVPKAFTRVEADGIEGVGLHPVRCTLECITRSVLRQKIQNA